MYFCLRAVQIRRGIKHVTFWVSWDLCLRAVQIRRGIKLNPSYFQTVAVWEQCKFVGESNCLYIRVSTEDVWEQCKFVGESNREVAAQARDLVWEQCKFVGESNWIFHQIILCYRLRAVQIRRGIKLNLSRCTADSVWEQCKFVGESNPDWCPLKPLPVWEQCKFVGESNSCYWYIC